MENTIPKPERLHKRWKPSEIRVMKKKLKQNLGNQSKTARELVEEMGRTVSAIQMKLSTLTRKHKSLRKSALRRKHQIETQGTVIDRVGRLRQRPQPENENGTALLERIVLFKDHVRIYF